MVGGERIWCKGRGQPKSLGKQKTHDGWDRSKTQQRIASRIFKPRIGAGEIRGRGQGRGCNHSGGELVCGEG